MDKTMTMEEQYEYWQSLIDSIEVFENEEMWASRVIDEYYYGKSPDSVSNVVINFPNQNKSNKS